MSSSPFRYFKTSLEIIRLAVMLYVRFPLRNVEDLLHERGIDVSHETVRYWWNRFGPIFAAEIRHKRVRHLRLWSQWRWHLDEAFVRINGKIHYLWRAVGHEGEVLEAYVTKRRDRKAALKSTQSDETVWPIECNRHRQTRLLPASAENDRQCCAPGNRPLAE
jgi:putative transposase